MSTYFPSSELTALLPGDHGLSAGDLTTCISAGSDDVNARLAHLYWPFTDYVASPAASPPWIIRQTAALFSAVHAYHLMAAANYVDGDSMAIKYYEHAMRVLEPYIAGTMQIPNEATYDLLTSTSWGDGDPYSSDEAPLSITGGEYVEGSAEVKTTGGAVTDYTLGGDFYITYWASKRKWVFTRGDSTIGSDVTGHRVYYEVSRIKKRETIQPGLRNVEMLRG